MTTNRIRTGAFACGGFGTSTVSTGFLGMSPMTQHHGIRLPFAGYAQVSAVAPTAALTDDAKVPDPRGRQR